MFYSFMYSINIYIHIYIYMSYQWTGRFLFISPSGHFKEGVADYCIVDIMAFELLKGDFHTQLLFSKSMYNTSFPQAPCLNTAVCFIPRVP